MSLDLTEKSKSFMTMTCKSSFSLLKKDKMTELLILLIIKYMYSSQLLPFILLLAGEKITNLVKSIRIF